MADLLGRMRNLVDSLFSSLENEGHVSGDPDFDEAWRELDRELGGTPGQRYRDAGSFTDMDAAFRRIDQARQEARKAAEEPPPRRPDPLEEKARELARDYHNLELKPGAGMDEVREAYKRMLKQYHPDRFAHDPEKQAIAHQVTVRINESHARLKAFLQGGT